MKIFACVICIYIITAVGCQLGHGNNIQNNYVDVTVGPIPQNSLTFPN